MYPDQNGGICIYVYNNVFAHDWYTVRTVSHDVAKSVVTTIVPKHAWTDYVERNRGVIILGRVRKIFQN